MPQEPEKKGIIDTRIPLVWLISLTMPIVAIATEMYFTVGNLKDTVADLKQVIHEVKVDERSLEKGVTVLGVRVDTLEQRVGRIEQRATN